VSTIAKEDHELLRVLGSVAVALDNRARRIRELEAEVALLGRENGDLCDQIFALQRERQGVEA
jgi:hypothetical protein